MLLLIKDLDSGCTAGKSMVWFGKPLVLFAIYGPAALAGLLIPPAALRKRLSTLRSGILGHGLLFSLIAVVLTHFNGRSGFMFAAWGFCSLAASAVVKEQVEAPTQFTQCSNSVQGHKDVKDVRVMRSLI